MSTFGQKKPPVIDHKLSDYSIVMNNMTVSDAHWDASDSVDSLIRWVQEQQFSLHLSSSHLAVLLTLAMVSQESLDEELTEAELHDAFYVVAREQGEEPTPFKANIMLNELVEQGLLRRFTSELTEGKSIYRLSVLAMGLADYYLRHRQFSQLKLSIQLSWLAGEMRKAVLAARQDGDLAYWRSQVYGVLKYSVAEIFDRIDLQQRVMDEQQHQVKTQISQLLHQHWQAAIAQCESLLAQTSTKLRELQDTLQAVADELQTQIIDIQEIIYQRNELDWVAEILAVLQMKLDRLIQWGQQAMDLWIGYDRHVHKFIRTAIDMDKNRAFSQRLRHSIHEFDAYPWQLTLASAERLMDLRDEVASLRNEEVVGSVPETMEYHEIAQIDEAVQTQIAQLLAQHQQQEQPLDLAQILHHYLAKHPASEHFDLTRLVIDQAVKLGYSSADRHALPAKWQAVNSLGAKVQAHVIDQYR